MIKRPVLVNANTEGLCQVKDVVQLFLAQVLHTEEVLTLHVRRSGGGSDGGAQGTGERKDREMYVKKNKRMEDKK